MSHARAHYTQATAAARTPENITRDSATQYELMLHQLALDKARLSGIQSVQKKAELKKDLIKQYIPWVEGVLSCDSGVQDDVLMTMMVWACDITDFQLAYRIARHALHYGLSMPDQFERSVATLLAGEISDRAHESLRKKEKIDAPLLIAVFELVADHDMPDKVRAMLAKAIGYACRDQEELDTAMQWLTLALTLDSNSGVKKDIERLETIIKRQATGAPATQPTGTPSPQQAQQPAGDMPAAPKNSTSGRKAKG